MRPGNSASLKIRLKDGTEFKVPVDRSPFVLGRGGADLDLDDASVSRRHCEIRSGGEGWLVKDLGSSNGTFLNGERVAESGLKEGDMLRLGQTEAEFRLEAVRSRRPGAGMYDAAVWSVVELSLGAADRDQWLRDFLGVISKKFAAERAFVVEYEAATGVARPIAALRGDYAKEGDDKEAPLSRTIVEQVVNERRPIVTTNADVDPRFSEAQSVDKYDIRTVVCAPVRWHGQIKGAIYLERKYSKDTYTEEDARGLQDIADLLGVALYAWRGHMVETRAEWEKDRLQRTFGPKRIQSILEEGGIDNVRRRVTDACLVKISVSRLRQLMDGSKSEAWKAISQFIGQAHEIFQAHGGAALGDGYGLFEAGGGREGEWAVEAVRAAMEAQRVARAIQKRLMREQQIGFAAGAGIGCGEMMVGYFGAGQRAEYGAMGDAAKVANILAFQANDGEILVDQAIYSKVHLFVDTARIAPLTIPGFDQQIQVYRIVSY